MLFEIAKNQVLQDNILSKILKPYHRSIVYDKTASYFKAISAEAASKHGFNSHCVIVDEVHAQPNRELIDVLVTSTGARRQPLIIFITTSDFNRPSICNEKYDFACKVRDGAIIDHTFLPVIYEAKPEDNWRDPEIWRKANPCLGISLKLEYLEQQCSRAIESPAYENTFKRLHLNIKTEQDVRWIKMDNWDKGNGALDIEKLKGKDCWAGLDLSSNTDITAFVLVFKVEGGYAIIPYFWIPKDNAEAREKKDKVPYVLWAKSGLITLTPGNVIDYERVRSKINNEIAPMFRIREIAMDPWNAQQLANSLHSDGHDVVMFRQGFASMSSPSKEFEKLVIGGQLFHGNNSILRWMASNVAVEIDAAGNIKPSKKKSTERIDGIVAAIMGLGRAALISSKPSVYKKRGLLVL